MEVAVWPLVDDKGLLRCCSRLSNVELLFDTKYPIMLNGNHLS